MPSDVSLTRGVAAAAFSFTSNVAADDTVVIGDLTYTFKAAPSSAFEVDVGSDLDDSIENLVAAINLSGTDDDEYGAGTTQNPFVSAEADTDNDELDLTARYPGDWVNGLHLAATSPGGNSITAAADFFAGVSGGTDGAGRLDEYISGVLDLTQIPSGLFSDLARMVEDLQDFY